QPSFLTIFMFPCVLSPLYLSCYGHILDLHSFPTRRSSDLLSGPDQPRQSLRNHPKPIISMKCCWIRSLSGGPEAPGTCSQEPAADRKSTRLNSSHVSISYAVSCLKKKNTHVVHFQTHIRYT